MDKKVVRRNTLIILGLVILVFALITFVFTWPFIRTNINRAYRTKDGILTPTQINTVGSTNLQGDGWSGIATYRAIYTIWGLVINKAEYTDDSLFAKTSPLDLGLAWGDMAKNNHLIKWHRGHRYVTAGINALYHLYINEDDEKLFEQYSNNHLVFTDDELLKQAQSLELGDYVQLKGYLVDIEAHKTSEPAIKWTLKTSLTRKDDGEDSCEILLVTAIDRLD
jgi:hypothetical protein